ncbi:E3 ubiquitin-protein ligase TRIM32 [Daphnia magna]|uniref:Uncharacterized protein n=2 Tax=Daphnia magna TaxID=35525 RepID=A0ABR0B5R5_9CRUS|nr:E3 ubiquitin-protein ligase TRIM32 [Daphnia magna]KAK4037028.1 hypothetical protein OUZ56_029072 [Daphnia magna]KZS04609.1 Uncharacterized protein APZ42_032419 [Daphnia magna]
MASSSSSPQWRIIERIICNACFEIHDGDQHVPKLLDCFHHMCKACVENRIVDGKIKCALCTKITDCPSGSSEEIYTDVDKMGLVEQLFRMCHINAVPLNFCDKCKEGAVEVCKVRMHKIYCITEDIRKYLLKIEFLRRAYEKETRADSGMLNALN